MLRRERLAKAAYAMTLPFGIATPRLRTTLPRPQVPFIPGKNAKCELRVAALDGDAAVCASRRERVRSRVPPSNVMSKLVQFRSVQLIVIKATRLAIVGYNLRKNASLAQLSFAQRIRILLHPRALLHFRDVKHFSGVFEVVDFPTQKHACVAGFK